MVSQSDISAALQRAGVNVYGLTVDGNMVSGTVGTGEERFKAVSAIQQVATDAQLNIQVNEGFADKSAPAAGGRTHTVAAGENFRKISQKIYGDEMQWKKIWEANKDKVPNPDKLAQGITLVIP